MCDKSEHILWASFCVYSAVFPRAVRKTRPSSMYVTGVLIRGLCVSFRHLKLAGVIYGTN